jgi:hypothetical protein
MVRPNNLEMQSLDVEESIHGLLKNKKTGYVIRKDLSKP